MNDCPLLHPRTKGQGSNILCVPCMVQNATKEDALMRTSVLRESLHAAHYNKTARLASSYPVHYNKHNCQM